MRHHELIARQAQPAASRLVLLVLDGIGDLRTAEQEDTALETAVTPNLDELATRSALGRIVPVAQGITPGSGPGHLALFGYDPTAPDVDIGRGVLEALGLGLEVGPGDVAVRCNFATADADGNLTDRRAGRPPTATTRTLCARLSEAVADTAGLTVRIEPGESHRFVLLLSGEGLSDAIEDTDPQHTGVPPRPLTARDPAARSTIERLQPALDRMLAEIAGEPQTNRILMRGFSHRPQLPSMADLYKLRLGAFAGYPLYRGVASTCGMDVVPCGKRIGDILDAVSENWQRFDYFFLHVKQTDQAGEDGDLAAKVAVLEEVDEALPRLLELGPDVLAITGDHSTPAPMRAHSWHPVPLLLHGPNCFIDHSRAYDERSATAGHLGTIRSCELMGLMLANGGRLAKFGA